MTDCTPLRPRTFNDRRNAVQNPSFFRVSDVEADYFAAPVGSNTLDSNTVGDDDPLGDDPVIHPGFAVGRTEYTYR